MTTTVKRGAGRPGAKAKREKHAQRNPVLGGKRDDTLKEAAMPKVPTPKFTTIGKGKYVHVFHTEKYDRANSGCQQVRKAMVAGKINYKGKGISPEAALALDPCPNCGTSEVAKRMLPAEFKRQAANDKRDEVMSKAKGESLSDRARKNRVTVKSTKAKAAAKPKVKAAPAKTKAGFRSVGAEGYEDKTQAKAVELAAFATEHGWSPKVAEDKPGFRMTATKGDLTVHCWFVDGKYDISRQAQIVVGEWKGTLRGAHAVRRQMTTELEDRDRPHPKPGKGRVGPRPKRQEEEVPEDESPEDAMKRVPFLLDDDDVVIIDAVKGKTIRWRNNLSKSVEEAVVPSSTGKGKRPLIRVTTHPQTGKRILDFLQVVENGKDGEVVGGERSIGLDRIIRVVD